MSDVTQLLYIVTALCQHLRSTTTKHAVIFYYSSTYSDSCIVVTSFTLQLSDFVVKTIKNTEATHSNGTSAFCEKFCE